MARQPSGALIWHAAGLTDLGQTRDRNEDAFAVDHDVLVVADGLGGHQGGAVASRFVATLAPSLLKQRLDARPRSTTDAVKKMIRDVILQAGRQLRAEADGRPELHGIGTTIVLACLRGDRAVVGHMGDSRAYVCRGGRLEQLTNDHSLVAILLRRREITESEARTHPARGKVSRYVGMAGDVLPDVRVVPLIAGDRLLLCSDGLTGMVDDRTIETTLVRQESPDTMCRELVAAANARGGRDNVTVIVAECLAAATRHLQGGSECRPKSS